MKVIKKFNSVQSNIIYMLKQQLFGQLTLSRQTTYTYVVQWAL